MSYYHWFDFVSPVVGPMLSHNLRIGKGELGSASLGTMETGDDGFMNPYSMRVLITGIEREKESVFENIRKNEFPSRPSRRATFWLFDDHSLAKRMGEEWELNRFRELIEVIITLNLNSFKADTQWLNCLPNDYTKNARKYWSGEMSVNPIPEVLLDGKIKLLGDSWKSKV